MYTCSSIYTIPIYTILKIGFGDVVGLAKGLDIKGHILKTPLMPRNQNQILVYKIQHEDTLNLENLLKSNSFNQYLSK
jgi:hypothetical protein